jgi:transcriptional regulator with XRE-family HTH domain
MSDNQHFIEATDFLKNTKKITFGEIAGILGIERHVIDNIRRGSQSVSTSVIDRLCEEFPETAKFFASKDEHEDQEDHKTILLQTQQKLIHYLEIELKKKTDELEDLKMKVKK